MPPAWPDHYLRRALASLTSLASAVEGARLLFGERWAAARTLPSVTPAPAGVGVTRATQGLRQLQLLRWARPSPRASLCSRLARSLPKRGPTPFAEMPGQRRSCCALTERLRPAGGRASVAKDTAGVGPSSTRRAAPPQSSRVRRRGPPPPGRHQARGAYRFRHLYGVGVVSSALTATWISRTIRLGLRGVSADFWSWRGSADFE